MKYLLTIIFLLISSSAIASVSTDSASAFCLRLSGGAGIGVYRDFGASPITFRGLELDPGISLMYEKGSWRYEGSLAGAGGGYGFLLGFNYMQAYGGAPWISLSAQHKIDNFGRWNFWIGGGVEDRCDIRYSSALGNACTGISNFFNVNLLGDVECNYGSWTIRGRLSLTPMSLLFRPGFAYMDNYDQEIGDPNANLFDQYSSYVSWATGASTEFGFLYRLKQGNRVGVCYRWNYFTSRTSSSCPHLFQQASHALIVNLDFAL